MTKQYDELVGRLRASADSADDVSRGEHSPSTKSYYQGRAVAFREAAATVKRELEAATINPPADPDRAGPSGPGGREIEQIELAYYEGYRDGFVDALDPEAENDPATVMRLTDSLSMQEGWDSSQAKADAAAPEAGQ